MHHVAIPALRNQRNDQRGKLEKRRRDPKSSLGAKPTNEVRSREDGTVRKEKMERGAERDDRLGARR